MLIGLDIGGTKTEAIVLDSSLHARGHATRATNSRTPALLVEGAVQTILEAMQEAGAARGQVAMIGVGIPGQVEPETGEVRLAVNLHLTAFPLGAALEEALQVPCRVENDVRAAAVGAYRSGGQGAARNLAYVNVGTGVSAGLILEGKLYRGAHGMAGEIGHIIAEPDGPLCNCGARGCLETLVAGPAIARMGQEAVEAGEDTVLQRAGTITAATVYEAAASGDGVALRITEQVGTTLGRALHALVMSYDVERIVLGGGVTGAGEVFLEAIRRAWARERAQSALARALLRPEMLHLTEQGRNMVAYGAGVLAAEAAGQVSASTGGSSFLTQTS